MCFQRDEITGCLAGRQLVLVQVFTVKGEDFLGYWMRVLGSGFFLRVGFFLLVNNTKLGGNLLLKNSVLCLSEVMNRAQ